MRLSTAFVYPSESKVVNTLPTLALGQLKTYHKSLLHYLQQSHPAERDIEAESVH